MQNLYRQLGGLVSVYMLDQRGTGQSTRLSCVLSSPSADNSTSAAKKLTELQECFQILNAQYNGSLAAFSITSAAYDLVTIISQLHTNSEVYVYGLGYGTLTVERLLHFGVAEVKGYILDGSATTSGAKKNQAAYVSKADVEFGRVGEAFLALCENDVKWCSANFPDKSVSETLEAVLANLDDDEATQSNSNCASSLVPVASVSDPASYRLRIALGLMMQNATERAFIPVLIYRLNRCNEQDKAVLQQVIARVHDREAELSSLKELVYDVQDFSELWEQPPPSPSTILSRFTDSLISSGHVYDQLSRYCIFAGDRTSESCATLTLPTTDPLFNSSSNSTRLVYPRDKYWNVAATIPAHASVLLLSGGIDGQSPVKYAQTLLDAMTGDAKRLLTFDSVAHNVLSTASLPNSSSSCGLEIVGSYIASGGALDVFDSSCIKEVPSLDFQITEAMSLAVLQTTDAYDGSSSGGLSENEEGSSSSLGSDRTSASSLAPAASRSNETASSSLQRSRDRYKVAFIVVLSILVLVLLTVAALLYRWWKHKQLKDEEDQLRRMRGEEPDDLELLRQIYYSSPTVWDKRMRDSGNDDSGHSNDAQKSFSSLQEWNYEPYRRSEPKTANGTNSAWVYRSNHLQL